MDFETKTDTKQNKISDKTGNKLREKDQRIPSNMSGLDSSQTAEQVP